MEYAPVARAIDAITCTVGNIATLADKNASGVESVTGRRDIEMFEPFSFQRTPARNGGEKGAKH
ncbi:hypothetical protein D9M70_580720 [compost metagenome]